MRQCELFAAIEEWESVRGKFNFVDYFQKHAHVETLQQLKESIEEDIFCDKLAREE